MQMETLQFKKVEAGFYAATDVAGNEIGVANYGDHWGWYIWISEGVSTRLDYNSQDKFATKKDCMKDARLSYELIGDKLLFCKFFPQDAILEKVRS